MENIAQQIAKAALEIKAVKLQPDDPFTWASGYKMPIYNDNRLFLFYSKYRKLIARGFGKLIEEKDIPCDMIAGTPTAGIPHGVLLADVLDKPFIYPRKWQKGHGMKNMIEGVPHPDMIKDKHVVMIEDLISTGGSSVESLEVVRSAGAKVGTCLSIFSYGFQKAQDAFDAVNATYYSLISLNTLISVVEEENYFNADQIKLLREWQASPFTWGERFK
jgi:orotate phosphoribosyltransferase